MRRYRTRGLLAVLGALLVVALGATAAAAEAPVKETITFSDTFPDEFLTQACGVEVTTTVNGRITFLPFPIDRSARRT
jgi:ABC-type glycerol-3-phosphate transport system substrate-binding protein